MSRAECMPMGNCCLRVQLSNACAGFAPQKKSGKCESGEEVQKLFKNLETRQQLIDTFKELRLNKAGAALFGCQVCQNFLRQDELKRSVVLMEEKKEKEQFNTKSGWFSERELKENLKLSKRGPQHAQLSLNYHANTVNPGQRSKQLSASRRNIQNAASLPPSMHLVRDILFSLP